MKQLETCLIGPLKLREKTDFNHEILNTMTNICMYIKSTDFQLSPLW
jgi:hypothetical protein